MPHDRDVKGDLAELASGIGIRVQQYVNVGLDKDANREFLDSEKNLCRGFMLAIEDFDRTGAVLLRRPPGQCDVKLGILGEKFLDESADARANGPWVDPVIMVQIFQWHGCEECIHPAELVVEQWKSADFVVANFTERQLNSVILAPEAQQRLGSTMLFKHMAEIGATLTVLCGLLLQFLKLSQTSRNRKV
jgi:hypothetical protein